MTGLCGENCKYCPRLIATKLGDSLELKKVRDLWVRLGLRDADFPSEKMVCHGCRPGNRCAYPKLRECVTAKRLESCGLCDHYPCDTIAEVYDKTEQFRQRAVLVCSREEMQMLDKAFFNKRKTIEKFRIEAS